MKKNKSKMKFNVLTIFPQLIDHYCSESILGRAQEDDLIDINSINIREFTDDKHNTVDAKPYGGGAGMVMKPEPIYKALKSIDGLVDKENKNKKTILMSPRGKEYDQEMARSFSDLDELTIICGRYEGVDQRVVDYMIDQEVSIGPYVLAGGELPALTVVESTSRLISGVLGNPESLEEESYQRKADKSIETEYPQYTRPQKFKDWEVPDVLLSGNHKKIDKWRKKNSK